MTLDDDGRLRRHDDHARCIIMTLDDDGRHDDHARCIMTRDDENVRCFHIIEACARRTRARRRAARVLPAAHHCSTGTSGDFAFGSIATIKGAAAAESSGSAPS